MKKILALSVVFALITGGLFFAFLRGLEKKSAVEYENVVVAAARIEPYTPITPEMLRIKQVPVGGAHKAAARTKEAVVGLVSESAILEDEQILPEKLKTVGSSKDGLSYAVESGYRAVTVPVSETSGVAWFLREGDYVDVLGILDNTPGRRGDGYVTEVYASDCKVLATGSKVAGTDGAGAQYESVTLQATPEQALRITVALTEGSLRLTLRGIGDHGASAPQWLWPTDTLPDAAWKEAAHDRPNS